MAVHKCYTSINTQNLQRILLNSRAVVLTESRYNLI